MSFVWLENFGSGTLTDSTQAKPIKLDDLAIQLATGNSREIAYTNKSDGVYYTETNAAHRNGWQGWRIMSQELLEGYALKDGNNLLNPENARSKVFPDKLIRIYPNGTKETFCLLDSIDAFVILLEGDLGAGKTTFVKSFGKCLSIEEDILSPTFILKKGYDAVHHKIKKIIHVSDLHIRTFQLHDMYKRQFKLFIDDVKNNGMESQGFFPIGNSCAKKVGLSYVHKNN